MINLSFLPEGYDAVEYIQTDGTQYIEINYVPNGKTKIETEVEFINVQRTGNHFLYGSRAGAGSKAFGFGYQPCWIGSYGNNNLFSIDTIKENFKYIIVQDNNVKINDDYLYRYQQTNFDAPYNLNVFCIRQDGGRSFYTSAKLYKMDIYEEDNQIIKLMPCYEKSTKKCGLYDIYNKIFYPAVNNSTTECSYGKKIFKEIKKIKINNSSLIDIDYIMFSKQNSLKKIFDVLPKEYQRIKYIEAAGAQYIDTGLSQTTQETEIEMDFEIVRNQEYQGLFCCRTDTTSNTRTLFITNLYGFRNDANGQKTISRNLLLNTLYSLKSTKTSLILNNQIIDTYNLTKTVNKKLIIMSAYDAATENPVYQSYIKIYSCKIKENNVLVRDFIPCYCKSDNAIGMYDLVEGQFYTNLGTGTFLKGPDI